MLAVLLAAGRGTRMGDLTRNLPKPLLPLQGRPILEHIVLGLRAAGVTDVVIVTGYLAEKIEEHFGNGDRFGLRIEYHRQRETNGTARALLLARDHIDAPFLMSWGDILVDPRLYAELIADFRRFPCDLLMSVNPVDDPWRGAAVYVDPDNRVTELVEKPPRGTATTRWNNAGVFIATPTLIDYAERLQPSPRGEYELPQAIAAMIADGLAVRAHPITGYWSDLGTPGDLHAANAAYPGRIEDDRNARLIARARETFGREISHLVRAPGRVNLIGEHTDYNGLPVMPMAIDRDVRIAVAPRDDRRVRLINVGGFEERRFELEADIPPFASGDWGNYPKAAAQGLVRHCGEALRRGADLMVDGNVPPGAGLSSSSALVVANALALLAANQIELPYPTLAELLPIAERYVGTMSGGMDQTISLLAEAEHALRIDFFPLRYRRVPLPHDYRFIVCHSLVHAEKSGSARAAYNQRVLECAIGCQFLADALPGRPRLNRLGDLTAIAGGRPLADLLRSLEGVLDEAPIAANELEKRLPRGSRSELIQQVQASGLPGPFFPLRRVRHVLHEADRVGQAEAALAAGAIARFGELMNDSHRSCRDDYEISCPELEELVALTRQHGAMGARLTGAGFGGCIIALAPSDSVDAMIEAVDRGFYRPRLDDAATIASSRFGLRPVRGAQVLTIDQIR